MSKLNFVSEQNFTYFCTFSCHRSFNALSRCRVVAMYTNCRKTSSGLQCCYVTFIFLSFPFKNCTKNKFKDDLAILKLWIYPLVSSTYVQLYNVVCTMYIVHIYCSEGLPNLVRLSISNQS